LITVPTCPRTIDLARYRAVDGVLGNDGSAAFLGWLLLVNADVGCITLL
jgi:hypothetical protein